MLEEAAIAPDTSSAAGRDLDSSSEETSCFEGALSSAREWGGEIHLKQTLHETMGMGINALVKQ